MKSKFYLIGLFLILLVVEMSAQTTLSRAERLYKDLGYKTAIPHYENHGNLTVTEMVRIANSYRLNHETENAELWYQHVVESSDEPIHKLHYAQALQSNKKYDLAKQYFEEYHAAAGGDDDRGIILATAIERKAQIKHTTAEVYNVKQLNTDKLDFSPSYFNQGIVFVSSRKIADPKDKKTTDAIKDIWINDNFMGIFHSTYDEDGELKAPEEFSLDLTTKYHEGPVSFSKSGDKIFFTRNDYLKKKRRNNSQGIMKLQIYTANKTGDEWSAPISLPFNTVEYEEAHPSISADGSTLYFSSDRPDGYGGMDIYMSKFRGGQWSAPINLGAEINTAGNEVFPFIHESNKLYFASDGLGGLGGLDIFSTDMVGDNEWANIENIGTPFNSEKDDFGFITSETSTDGFFTSARDGGFGKDDIYAFRSESTPYEQIVVCTYKEETNERINEVEVTVVEKMTSGTTNDETENVQYFTNKNGEFSFPIRADREYVFTAKKDGFTVVNETISTFSKSRNALRDMDFCIPLNSPDCLALEGVVKNKKYGNIIPNADVTMINLCTGEEVVVKSDNNGQFSFPCLDCDCEFTFKGEKDNFIEGTNRATTMNLTCENGGKVETEVVLELTPGTPQPQIATTSTVYSAAPVHTVPPINIGTLVPANTICENVATTHSTYTSTPTHSTYRSTPTPMHSNMTIELQNIFYDFDEYYIRDGDAKRDLDKVVSLMQAYPSLTIELGSHTDARGTDRYNRKLSQKRANAAIEYIINQGISKRRVTAVGYGETQIRNHCENFEECTEDEHQENRRTEVKIIDFDEPGVSIQYIDNMPEIIDEANPGRRWTWD